MNTQSQNISIIDKALSGEIRNRRRHYFKKNKDNKIIEVPTKHKRSIKVLKKIDPIIIGKYNPCNSFDEIIDMETTYSTKKNKLLDKTYNSEIPKRLIVGPVDSYSKICREKEENARNISKLPKKLLRTSTRLPGQKGNASRPESSSSSTYGAQTLNALSMMRRSTK